MRDGVEENVWRAIDALSDISEMIEGVFEGALDDSAEAAEAAEEADRLLAGVTGGLEAAARRMAAATGAR